MTALAEAGAEGADVPAVIAALIGGLWIQRDDLEECQRTCSCSLFGQDVSIPDAKLPSILDAGENPELTLCHRDS